MDASSLTFGIKDVLGIASVVASAVGLYWAMKNADKDNKAYNRKTQAELDAFKRETSEKFMHAKNSKKANVEMLLQEINKSREEMEKKETQIYTRMNEIRTEQKDAHDKLSTKMDTISTQMAQVNTTLAELTGYIKATKKDK